MYEFMMDLCFITFHIDALIFHKDSKLVGSFISRTHRVHVNIFCNNKNNVLIQTLYDPKHILFVTALEEGKNRHLK
jgi:hypothetical protein